VVHIFTTIVEVDNRFEVVGRV